MGLSAVHVNQVSQEMELHAEVAGMLTFFDRKVFFLEKSWCDQSRLMWYLFRNIHHKIRLSGKIRLVLKFSAVFISWSLIWHAHLDSPRFSLVNHLWSGCLCFRYCCGCGSSFWFSFLINVSAVSANWYFSRHKSWFLIPLDCSSYSWVLPTLLFEISSAMLS